MRILIFLILILSQAFFPPQVSSHGFGASFEKAIGNYFIDVGYEPEWFTAGETSTFSFLLLKNDTKDPVEFDDVWVRIAEGTRTIFATGVNANLNNAPTMLFTFPKDGDYTLFVRYQKDDEELVETSFPIKVDPAEQSMLTPERVGILILGLAAGGGGIFIFSRYKTKVEKPRRKKEKS